MLIRKIYSAVALILVSVCASGTFAADNANNEAAEFIRIAEAYAECMITFGRDRYGEVRSPLFANALTREEVPDLTPYPLFAEMRGGTREIAKRMKATNPAYSSAIASSAPNPFFRFEYNDVLNYPANLGVEGPHKVTVYGSDPLEDRHLYSMLFALSRVTGNELYANEARAALVWFFDNTQSPVTGLYPWGEHLGWDFEYEMPTYFAGPSKHLYAASYHEIKDEVPFLDILAARPPHANLQRTPLERYAWGIWQYHFWDKDRAIFCRHGDYLGADDRTGSLMGFPAHLAAYFQVWSRSCSISQNEEFTREMKRVFNHVVDKALARTKKYGFFPFSYEPDILGSPPKRAQSDRLARVAFELIPEVQQFDVELADKLSQLAELHGIEAESSLFKAIDTSLDRVKLSEAITSGVLADRIITLVQESDHSGDASRLEIATALARKACLIYFDDKCPLPRAVPGIARETTAQGEPFPDFYFGGAKLGLAIVLLSEALIHQGE